MYNFVMWQNFSCGDNTQTSTYPKYRACDRQMNRYHQSPTLWAVSFIGIAYRNMGKKFLIGAEMAQRQLNYQSPPIMADSSQKHTGDHYTTCRHANKLESVFSNWLSLNPYQATGVVSESSFFFHLQLSDSSFQLCLLENHSQQPSLFPLEEGAS